MIFKMMELGKTKNRINVDKEEKRSKKKTQSTIKKSTINRTGKHINQFRILKRNN
jgi:hypothetical protein